MIAQQLQAAAQEEVIQTLAELSAIGLDIAAKLNPEKVFESFHHVASRMLDMRHLAIYRLTPETGKLHQVFGIENGIPLLPIEPISVNDPHSFCARVVRERTEIVIDDATAETMAAHIPGTHVMRSFLFIPLAAGDRLLGVISIQSTNAGAYGQRERFICRTLAAYGAIALENAEAYRRLDETTAELDRTNRSLLVQRDELDRANRAKTHFFAAASHDLRQPMQALLLLVGSLEHRTKDAVTCEITTSIRASVEALHELFDALMDISKFDAGAVQPQLRQFQIHALLERIKGEYVQQAGRKHIDLRIRPCTAVVLTDPILLYRIVANLTNNAVRHTSKGRVLIGCRRIKGGVRLEVRDTGPGIPEDKLAEIFREFFQLERPQHGRGEGQGQGKGQAQGQGLGLAIVERATKLLKHRLAVRSVLGKGSVFSIDIPYGDQSKVVAQCPGAGFAAQTQLADRCVLVIDDEEEILDAMAHLLKGWGCVVLCAKSGVEASRALRKRGTKPDAVICDYRLANDECPLDLIAALNAEFGYSPCILISGDTASSATCAAEQSGYRLLAKPIAPAKLRSLLNNLLTASHRDDR